MQAQVSQTATFHSPDADHFADSVSRVAPDVRVEPGKRAPFRADVKLVRLPRLGLFTVRTDHIRVISPEGRAFVSTTIPLKGSFVMTKGGGARTFGPGSAHVVKSDEPFELAGFDPFSVLVFNPDVSLLQSHAEKLGGGRAPFEVETCSRLSLATPEGASFWRFLSFVWGEVNHGGTLLRSPLVTREVEDALLTICLYAASSRALGGEASRAFSPLYSGKLEAVGSTADGSSAM